MAHFAEIDENNKVLQVIVVNNNELIDENGNESETKGIIFCKNIFGENTNWVQTSYTSRQRKNYAGIGYIYDSNRDAFISPKPFNSWILDEDSCQWMPPIPRPSEGIYDWNEDSQSWQLYITT